MIPYITHRYQRLIRNLPPIPLVLDLSTQIPIETAPGERVVCTNDGHRPPFFSERKKKYILSGCKKILFVIPTDGQKNYFSQQIMKYIQSRRLVVASRSGTHFACLYDDRDVVCVAAGSWQHSRFCVSSISPALSEIRPIVSIWTRSHRSSLGCRLRDVRTLGDCSVRLLTLHCISTRVDLVFY